MSIHRKGRSSRFGVAALAALAVMAARPAAAVAQAGDEAAVRAAMTGFKDALRAGDGERAVDHLHPDVQVFEGGHAETLEEYRSGHLAADMRFLAAVDTETTWEAVEIEGDLALYMSRYHTTGTFRDREIDAHGTETMVLRRTADGWRIRHIHWSSR